MDNLQIAKLYDDAGLYQKAIPYYEAALKDNEDYKCLAGPYEFQVYTRQIDGGILLSDGRTMSAEYSKGSVVTQIKYGDSEKISSICYNKNYNYLVINNETTLTEDLEELGFDKIISNNQYTLYKMNDEKMEELYN